MQDQKYKRLISSLQLMALQFESQIAILPDFVCQADEIALTFDESYKSVAKSENYSLLPEEVRNKIEELDKHLDEMSNKGNLWSVNSLRDSQDWKICRNFSRNILLQLNEPLSEPDISFIKFVSD